MLHRFLWATTLSLLLTGPAFTMCADCDFSGQNLAFADFRDQDLSGARANNAKLRNARLSNASFARAEIELVDFTDAKMTGADFHDAFVRHAKMTKDQAMQSNYCQVSLRDATARRTLCE